MSVKKYKEKEDDFHLLMRHSDVCKFLGYHAKIRERLKEGKTIPLRYYDKMFSLFIPKDFETQEHYNKILKDIKQDTMSFLTQSRMRYDFCFKKEIGKGINDIPADTKKPKIKLDDLIAYYSELSLDKMITEVVYIASKSWRDNKTWIECVCGCYEFIDNYTKKDERLRNLYTHYKINVISGYITWKFGYALADKLKTLPLGKKYPTTNSVDNPVKYHTVNYNTYPKKEKRK